VSFADSFWERNSTVVSAVVAIIIGIVIGWLVPWIWRQRDRATKTLDYRVISDFAIMTSHRPDGFRIIFGTVDVDNPFISQIRFKNTGKQVIETEDFLERFIILRPASKLLDFNVVEQSDQNLVRHIGHIPERPGTHETVGVTPNTLNPGDWFTVQLLYDGDPSSDPQITGRIKGQTRKPQVYLTRQERPRDTNMLPWSGGLVLLVLLIFLAFQYDFGSLWWLIFPLGGAIGGSLRALVEGLQVRAKLKARQQDPQRD
jgi:hypothetical protein